MKITGMLTTQDISCFRHDQALFSGLNLCCVPGDILHIIGPNGCGKSTLLQILNGLMLPQQGTVCWSGSPITDIASNYRAQLLYLGHKIGVKANLTVLENLQLFTQLSAVNHRLDWDDTLSYFDLQHVRDRICQCLSAGQRQRVALTRLLIATAPLWILDEPFTALDLATIAIMKQLLLQHCARGGMVILTSHHPLDFPSVSLKTLYL